MIKEFFTKKILVRIHPYGVGCNPRYDGVFY